MLDRKKRNARAPFVLVLFVAGIVLSISLTGCSAPKPAEPEKAPSRYSLSGRVVSVDKAKQQVVVDAGDIPGFMPAMQMGYAVKNSNLLEPLSAEDQITADVVVKGNDVFLENVVVVKKPDQAAPPASKEGHPAMTPAGKK